VLSDLSHPTVWGLLPAGGVLLPVATYTAVWLVQPLWERAGIPLMYYGWAWAALNLS
jgi:hypothetical protein